MEDYGDPCNALELAWVAQQRMLARVTAFNRGRQDNASSTQDDRQAVEFLDAH